MAGAFQRRNDTRYFFLVKARVRLRRWWYLWNHDECRFARHQWGANSGRRPTRPTTRTGAGVRYSQAMMFERSPKTARDPAELAYAELATPDLDRCNAKTW